MGVSVTIGEKIREIRMKRGMTQAELAGEFVTPSMISQIEADRVKPSYPLLTEIANRLGAPVEQFLLEIDGQSFLSAKVNLAAYALSLGRPEEAMGFLSQVSDVPEQGTAYEQYLLVLARACRQLKQYPEAINHLEHLRELAYHEQDVSLLFLICRESGYVEFDQGNLEGAAYEWRHALEYGQSLQHDGTVPRMELSHWMLDVLLQMDRIDNHTPSNDHENDRQNPFTASKSSSTQNGHRPHLDAAREWITAIPNLRTAAENLFADALAHLPSDPSASKSLSDRARTLTTFAKLFEQVLTVRARLADADGDSQLRVAQETAFSMMALYPETFLTTACDQIQRLLDDAALDDAEAVMKQVHSVLCALNRDGINDTHQNIALRLELLTAQMDALQGRVVEGIEKLARLEEIYPEQGDVTLRRQVCALLVLYYGKLNDVQNVLKYSRKMDDLNANEGYQIPMLL